MAHPIDAEAWEWDEGNESELAGHAIAPEEVEQLHAGAVWAKNKSDRAGDYKMMGVTAGGRRLTVIVRYDSDGRTIRPITGWDATPGELTRYFGTKGAR